MSIHWKINLYMGLLLLGFGGVCALNYVYDGDGFSLIGMGADIPLGLVHIGIAATKAKNA